MPGGQQPRGGPVTEVPNVAVGRSTTGGVHKAHRAVLTGGAHREGGGRARIYNQLLGNGAVTAACPFHAEGHRLGAAAGKGMNRVLLHRAVSGGESPAVAHYRVAGRVGLVSELHPNALAQQGGVGEVRLRTVHDADVPAH